MARPWQPSLALQIGLTLAMAGAAPQAAGAEPVDVELILAVDVSLSMSPEELAIQRDGYAAALTHEQVIRAIEDGIHGKIALVYVEWAGQSVQRVVVPWTLVGGRAEAEAVAERLSLLPPNGARRTSIAGMLNFAGDLFAENEYRGLKRVVDVSGDGPNNQGPLVAEARDRLVSQGVTINGLPLMTSGGFSSVYDLDNLDIYYQNCVVGGPGSFVIPVNDWSQFPEAVRRKLVLELAGTPGEAVQPPVRLASVEVDAADCEIGEKMWQNRSWRWQDR